ncbi:MAG: type II toxin-antitoxin system ParD family antitoxin [Gammaproteobacteria bacterium]|nr:type II toxin-antitoxin system ParD family antitoxin [Gammaproteobacteria bacterium]MCW8959010.1 type II toxin-antitoxin system ParD family antitoxin [Gammaproteobacteria bacterium]MCW8992924.1 type II toxin-antitoxin system ParD family antitoxin [Gammaproteobacteria bacterium]
MATMNVSLPEAMKQWVEKQARSGRYSNTSDYVRDLIRRDQELAVKIAHMQTLVTQGVESGTGNRTMEEQRETAGANATSHSETTNRPQAWRGH